MADTRVGPLDWSCGGKRVFTSKVDADRAATLSRRRQRSTTNAYKCPRCRQWHIGPGDRNYRTPPPRAA